MDGIPKPGNGIDDAQALRAQIGLLHGFDRVPFRFGSSALRDTTDLPVRLPHREREAHRPEVVLEPALHRFAQRKLSRKRPLRRAVHASGVRTLRLNGGIDRIDAGGRARRSATAWPSRTPGLPVRPESGNWCRLRAVADRLDAPDWPNAHSRSVPAAQTRCLFCIR